MDLLGTVKTRQPEPSFEALALDWLGESLTDQSTSPPDPPQTPPAPCSCLCVFHWVSLDGSAHCCDCRPIPSRRMLVSLWEAVANPWRWQTWRPAHWDPFADIDEQRQQLASDQAAKQAVNETF